MLPISARLDSRLVRGIRVTAALQAYIRRDRSELQDANGTKLGESNPLAYEAPDFTITGANAEGARMPVKLSEYRGRVVVLAFYPLDRSSGCTAELTKFRDDFSSLFGDGVVVLPVSVDSVGSHASWAKDMKFPFTLLSDPDQKVAATYGSTMAGRPFDARTVYVIGRDGKVTYRNMKFGALSADAYKDLAAAIAKAKGP